MPQSARYTPLRHLGSERHITPCARERGYSSIERRILHRFDSLDRLYDANVQKEQAKRETWVAIMECIRHSDWADDHRLLSVIEPLTPTRGLSTSRSCPKFAAPSSDPRRQWGHLQPVAIRPPSRPNSSAHTARGSETQPPADSLDVFMGPARMAQCAGMRTGAGCDAAASATPVRIPFRLTGWRDAVPAAAASASTPELEHSGDALDAYLRRTEHLRFFARA